MMRFLVRHSWKKSQLWHLVAVVAAVMVVEVMALNGSNVCMVKQKYNITKRIKYRAPMSVRTYEWCFSMPPRCSRWNTEMRDLTRLETEVRTAEVAICCPGYKMKDVSCVPICPNGKTGTGCSEDCQPNRWGPNCVNECQDCSPHGSCSPVTGECVCLDGWQGESCETVFSTTTTASPTTQTEDLLTTTSAPTKTTVSPSIEFTLLTTPVHTVPTTTKRMLPTTTAFTTTMKTANVSRSSMVIAKLKNSSLTTMSTTNVIKIPRFDGHATPASSTIQTDFDPYVISDSENIKITVKPEKAILSTYTTDNPDITTPLIIPYPVTRTPYERKSKPTVVTQAPVVSKTTPGNITTQKYLPVTSIETTRKPETTVRLFPTTLKFKPKEIWIKPAQKGESPIIEMKKFNQDLHTKIKNISKFDIVPNTTPKTIIVSIIPTSVSYVTFKKIALTTASYTNHKTSGLKFNYKHAEEITKSTLDPASTTVSSFPKPSSKLNSANTTKQITTSAHRIINKHTAHATLATKRTPITKFVFVNNTTNSMTSTINASTTTLNSPQPLPTTIPSSNVPILRRSNTVTERMTARSIPSLPSKRSTIQMSTERSNVAVKLQRNNDTNTKKTSSNSLAKSLTSNNVTNDTKTNATLTKAFIVTTTDKPMEDEEKFHILTEPEHITAVMNEKETERSSLDLISVISIAGGVMMAVITVAVVIVMMERCRRPSYENVRKLNDIRMQVMIDNNDVPPPYMRSIFHTPLPDPPTNEKCHYQPISTLDRNLKQFMRPVIVQTISPMMIENFRGILECHYDHLPPRTHDFERTLARCSVTPSVSLSEQPLLRASLTESAIEALKCEAKFDVIDLDTTTSEPLYAEIPCWRPPSEHAIEVMNVNGEAVTEL